MDTQLSLWNYFSHSARSSHSLPAEPADSDICLVQNPVRSASFSGISLTLSLHLCLAWNSAQVWKIKTIKVSVFLTSSHREKEKRNREGETDRQTENLRVHTVNHLLHFSLNMVKEFFVYVVGLAAGLFPKGIKYPFACLPLRIKVSLTAPQLVIFNIIVPTK